MVPHRRPVQRGPPAVDHAHQLVYLTFQVTVAVQPRAGRDCHRDQDDLAPPLRIPLQEQVERSQALGDALGVVQPVDPQDQLAVPRPLTDDLRLTCRLGLADSLRITVVIDTHGKRVHQCESVVECDAPQLVLHAQKPSRASKEIAHVVVGVKADQVGAEQSRDHLFAPRHHPKRLERWEWDVQEEPNRRIGHLVAQHLGQEHELVVLHPDHIARPRDLEHRVAETLVGLDVRLPHRQLELDVLDEVVEQRPKRAVRKAVVVAAYDVFGQEDRHALMLLAQRRDYLLLLPIAHTCRGKVCPPDPQALVGIVVGSQARRHAADTALEDQFAFALLDGDGKPVRDEDKSLHMPGASLAVPSGLLSAPPDDSRHLYRIIPRCRQFVVSVYHVEHCAAFDRHWAGR